MDFFKSIGVTSLDIYFDPDFKLVKQFKMRGLPTSILIDKNGKEFGRVVGEINFTDKDFIKLLTSKLLDWTNIRWLISLTKEKGSKSFKDVKIESKKNLIESAKTTETFKKIIEKFSDAELVEIEKKND